MNKLVLKGIFKGLNFALGVASIGATVYAAKKPKRVILVKENGEPYILSNEKDESFSIPQIQEENK